MTNQGVFMHRKAVAVLLLAVFACGLLFAATEEVQERPKTLEEKFSYAFGVYLLVNYGEDAMSYLYSFQSQAFPDLDLYYGYLGMYEVSQGTSPYTVDELNGFLSDYYDGYEERMAARAAENLKIAEDFLKDNKTKAGVKTTSSGLQYKVIKQGSGAKASASDSVELDYELKLLSGEVIDSSYERGEHATFPLSAVIQGFKEGVMLMPMGSHYIFYIHPDLGYGEQSNGAMGPNSLLIFEVETYSIVK